MKSLLTMVLVAMLLAGCAGGGGSSDCEQCTCDCPVVKMTDLDFFGTYYSPCVEYVRDLKALYESCGNYVTGQDTDACLWSEWNEGTPPNVCANRLQEIAYVNSLGDGDRCEHVNVDPGSMGSCEYGVWR